MIYRKAPPQPGRLLLRVVAFAGAGAALASVACSSAGVVAGSVETPHDAGLESGGHDGGFVGFMGVGDGGGSDVFNGLADAGGGIMGATDGQAPDANPDGGACDEGCGLVGNPDAAADVITGVVAHPDGGTD
jgi:hypothetical protein